MKVSLKTPASENPFYGKLALFEFYQSAQSGKITPAILTNAFRDCKTDQDKQLFWIIAFSCGDISNRTHNVLRNETSLDNGGNSNREAFRTILNWTRLNHPTQYLKFVTSDCIRQYTTLDNVLASRVKTKTGSKQVTENINMLEGVDLQLVAKYLANIIRKGNVVDCMIIAKFLTNVRTSKRQKLDRTTREKVGQRELSDLVKANMKLRSKFYDLLSVELGWEVSRGEKYKKHTGLAEWKKQYNQELESVLFSTGKINDLDKIQFNDLLDKMPSSARFRTRRRLLDGDDKLKSKWKADLGKWLLKWETNKAKLQETQRELTEKIRLGTASEEDKIALSQVKKAAKVNTGGETMFSILKKMQQSTTQLNLNAQSILDQVKFDVPVLTIADISGSMTGVATFMARLLSTITMLKNPSNELDNVLITFGSEANVYTDGSTGTTRPNRFLQGVATKVEKLIDRTKPFSENYGNISKFIDSNGGSTNFTSVADTLGRWIESDPLTKQHKIEQLQGYPVFVVVSDGDMNRLSNAAQSMLDFRRKMLNYGWDGVVVIWDVVTGRDEPSKFAGVPNTLHIMGYNAGVINQIFKNIDDLDVIDTYLPLKTLYMSNRYEMVKMNVI
jgi:hypothetical protein